MAIHYLQKKVTPVANSYIIVGSDGNLITSANIPSGMLPVLNITANSSITNIKVESLSIEVPVVKISDTSYTCKLPQFGYWKVYGIRGADDVISDVILVEEIKTYSCNLTTIPSL